MKLLELLPVTASESPLEYLVVRGHSDRARAASRDMHDLLLAGEERNDARSEHRVLRRHAIHLPMHVEAPSVQVSATYL